MGEPTIKDYSQIELRILAHLSKNPLLSNTFTDERDIHRATAAEVFDVPFEDVTEEQRCWAPLLFNAPVIPVRVVHVDSFLRVPSHMRTIFAATFKTDT